MIRFIYTLIYYLVAPLLSLRWLYKSFKPPQYREPILERFGIVTRQPRPSIWFHAVSVGESIVAISLIQEFLKRHPDLNIVVTTTTPTGAKVIKEALEDSVTHYYSPCDLPGVIRRFADRIQLSALVILETELWPNWLHQLRQRDIPIILANARLSQKSANNYRKLSSLVTQMMDDLSLVLPVNQADAKRYIELGLAPKKCQVTGNIKYDIALGDATEHSYFDYWENLPVWIAASTHKGEDDIILSAHQAIKKVIPQLKLIIVPRHPERFFAVAELIEQEGFSYCRRSKPDEWQESCDILLGDTMGELIAAYRFAAVAFVGGSFVDVGGHNAIEPALLSKPILTGPVFHNFQVLFESLVAVGAAKVVENEQQLVEQLSVIFQDKELACFMGKQGKEVILASQGAKQQTVSAITEFLALTNANDE